MTAPVPEVPEVPGPPLMAEAQGGCEEWLGGTNYCRKAGQVCELKTGAKATTLVVLCPQHQLGWGGACRVIEDSDERPNPDQP